MSYICMGDSWFQHAQIKPEARKLSISLCLSYSGAVIPFDDVTIAMQSHT